VSASQALQSQKTEIPGVYIIERTRRGDERGYFERIFCHETLQNLGWQDGIAQVNHSFTAQKGAVRGLHYQLPPFAESKLVTCLRGEVCDVVLDLRADSPQFLRHISLHLSGQNHRSVLIPPGCAHGFQTLTDDVDMFYCHSTVYSPQSEAGINVLDPRLQLHWPLPITQRSERDLGFSFLAKDFEGVTL
jgi:dTDP-4-dehydrorhamnose 3,5-epimerase